MAKETIILHLGWKAFLDILSDEELGQWTRAIMQYMETGNPPQDMSRTVQVAFFAASERISRDAARYEEISEARRKAGHRGGIASADAKQNQATPSKTKQSQAKPTLPDPDPVPDPDSVLSSSSDDNRPAAPAAETMTTTTPVSDILEILSEVKGCQSTTARRELAGWVDKMGHDAVMDIARDCVSAGAESWSYVRRALENRASGVDARPRGRNVRVDRSTPSGNDFIKAAVDRPRRLKRRD